MNALESLLRRVGGRERWLRFRIGRIRRVLMNGRPLWDVIAEPPARFVKAAAFVRHRAAMGAHYKQRWNGAMSEAEAAALFRLAAPEYTLMMARRAYMGRRESDRMRLAERYIVACLREVEGIPTCGLFSLAEAMAEAFEEGPSTIGNAWATRPDRPRRLVKK